MKSRRGFGVAAGVLAAIAAVCLVIAGVLTARGDSSAQPSQVATGMNGRPVVLDPGVTAIPISRSHAVDQHAGQRFVVPSVGLNVPLGALDEVDGEVTPPGFTSAYRIRNLGVSPKDSDHGTTYVVMHSATGGATAPGNYLTDISRGVATVKTGAVVRVAGASYRVTGWEAVRKNQLASTRTVWSSVPDRLVIITCLERPQGGPSISNIVITAKRT